MLYFVVVLLAVNASVFCARVKEFPFDIFNSSNSGQNVTTLEEMTTMSTLVSEVIEELTHLEEEVNTTISQNNLSENKEGSPILSALRNFWAQASVSLLEPVGPTQEEPKKSEQVFRAIERGLVEATTLLSQIEETTTAPSILSKKQEAVTIQKSQPDLEIPKSNFPPVSHKKNNSEPNLSKKRKPDSTPPKKLKPVPVPQKRQGEMPEESSETVTNTHLATSELVTNLSLSCSSCYERLNRCVLRCFEENNCKDVERSVRICPPTPSRICNMFTQWNPVDECSSDADCSSPLLCCNDGCKNKCLPGIWSS